MGIRLDAEAQAGNPGSMRVEVDRSQGLVKLLSPQVPVENNRGIPRTDLWLAVPYTHTHARTETDRQTSQPGGPSASHNSQETVRKAFKNKE